GISRRAHGDIIDAGPDGFRSHELDPDQERPGVVNEPLIMEIVGDLVRGNPFSDLEMDRRDGSKGPPDPKQDDQAGGRERKPEQEDFRGSTWQQSDKPPRWAAGVGSFFRR